MYYYLLNSLKRRVILELQDSFSRHPVYEKIVPYIQNKFVFEERPQFGIVLKGSSANKVQLSADNYLGRVESHVMLSYLSKPAYMLEWVREDTSTLNANGGVMPTAAGVYYMECLCAPTNPTDPGKCIIDPLLTVTDEPVLQAVSGIESYARLANIPIKGTLKLWENRNHLLVEDKDYTVDYGTAEVTLLFRLYPGGVVTADYRYPAPSIGPFDFYWNRSDAKTLPGVVLAFGKRARVGDKVAVVVTADRVDTANAYGGKFEVNFELDIIAQDPVQMEEIADFTVMSMWSEKKPLLEYEGIELIDISIGGEAEEEKEPDSGIFFYTASISMQLQADWEVHHPLPLTIARLSTSEEPKLVSNVNGRVENPSSNLHMIPKTDLFFSTVYPGRNHLYERIT